MKNAQAKEVMIGRTKELAQIRACLAAKRNVLIEGPVGVGKTRLALAVTESLGMEVFRVDGDSRYTEQKLTGWFDPPTVISKGFVAEAFLKGPLTDAMQKGGALFINELNRLPEGVQNVLLPAIDERWISIPRLGEIRARDGFLVIATQNPKEFVATSHLSEAILDRFELVVLDYQSEAEEIEIVSKSKLVSTGESKDVKALSEAAVRLIRMTRNHPRVRRGASVRAAISVVQISAEFLRAGDPLKEAFLKAVLLALPTRIELERDADTEVSQRTELETLLRDWAQGAFEGVPVEEKKKK